MNYFHQQDNISDMATKAALPVTVSGMSVFGVPVPDLVQIITLIYVIIMAVDKGYSFYLRFKNRNEPEE